MFKKGDEIIITYKFSERFEDDTKYCTFIGKDTHFLYYYDCGGKQCALSLEVIKWIEPWRKKV